MGDGVGTLGKGVGDTVSGKPCKILAAKRLLNISQVQRKELATPQRPLVILLVDTLPRRLVRNKTPRTLLVCEGERHESASVNSSIVERLRNAWVGDGGV